jgi:hypothetical protein
LNDDESNPGDNTGYPDNRGDRHNQT